VQAQQSKSNASDTPGRIDRLGPVLGDWNDRIDALLADESEIRGAR
jgi:hypothetical protein